MEFIDGHPVVAHRVRFRGRAEIDVAHAGHITDGRFVAWLVMAQSGPPSFHPTKKDGEERYRFAIQEVEAAVPIPEGPVRDSAIVYMNSGSDQGYLAFDNPHQTAFGFVDPTEDVWHEQSPVTSERETGRLARYLHENWGYDINETVVAVDIAIKLLDRYRDQPPAEPTTVDVVAPVLEAGPEVAKFSPAMVDGLTDHDDDTVERIGSIYGPNHEGRNQALINKALGNE